MAEYKRKLPKSKRVKSTYLSSFERSNGKWKPLRKKASCPTCSGLGTVKAYSGGLPYDAACRDCNP